MNGNMLTEVKKYRSNYKHKVIEFADTWRDIPMPSLTEELFGIFEKSGSRLEYENVYFTRRKYLATYGILSIMDRKKEDILKLEEVLLHICKEECWGLPAHVNRDADPNWRISIDLFAAETAGALAEIITVLDGELSKEVKDEVRENVFKRVLNPFYGSNSPYSSWEHAEHNWCAVCSGSIGIASIYLLKEEPDKLNQYLERICASLSHYIDGFLDDGACMEGLSYFTYGMTYYVSFAVLMYEYSNGRVDLLNHEKCAKIASFQQKCYFSGGRSISFSDGNSREHFKMGLTAKLALTYKNVSIPNMEQVALFDFDSGYRWIAIYRDYIWVNEYVDKIEVNTLNLKKEDQIVLPSSQWSICESENNIGMAAKGGSNDEPHNHNDIGNFLYVNGHDMLLTDLGAGEYTKNYFGPGRYEILCNSSFGHNVPIINEKPQPYGKEYKSSIFKTDGHGKTTIEFSGAYERETLTSLIRDLDFNRISGELVVTDTFILSDKTTSIKENLVTEFEPVIENNEIKIYGEETGCIITVNEGVGPIEVITMNHSNHGGKLVKVYLIRMEVPIGSGDVRVRFVIKPV
jgi:hypothetical protein